MTKLARSRLFIRVLSVLAVVAVVVPSSPSLAIDYEVTFEAYWTAADHPNGFPLNAHFSSLIGASHDASVSFWSPGLPASVEIERVAENGNRGPLEALIDASPSVLDKIVTPGIFSPGSTPTLLFTVDATHPYVTLASMVAPSPDWFVGVHGLDLRDSQGFVESLVIDLVPYDAGTEDGVGFSGSNPASVPQGVVHLVDQASVFGGISPIARFRFERVSEPGGSVTEVRASTSTDDAEERADGSVSTFDAVLELVDDGSEEQLVGVRFEPIPVSRGADVREAWIQFEAAQVSDLPADLEIRAEAVSDSAPFSTAPFDVSSRLRTSAAATWLAPVWFASGEQMAPQRTPNLALLVEEVLARPDWSWGNAMTFIIDGSGTRAAMAADGTPQAAAQLHIRWSLPAPGPTCGLGPELVVVLAVLFRRRVRLGIRTPHASG